MASGNLLYDWTPQGTLSPSWLYVAFTSGGTTTPSLGATVWGDTSNANAVLEYVVVNTGSWAGGDAAGYFLLSNWNGTAWTSGENFTFNSTAPANNGTFTATPVANTAALALGGGYTPVLDFDATVNEVALFQGYLPANYSGGGLTLKLTWGSTATANGCVWNGFFRRGQDETDNWLSTGADPSGLKSFASPQAVTASPPGTAGQMQYSTITFTSGAQMGSIAANEVFQLLIQRDAQNSNDGMAADARLVHVALLET